MSLLLAVVRWVLRLRRAPCAVFEIPSSAFTTKRIGDSLDLLARALRARQREA
jgi:hypothetical protein